MARTRKGARVSNSGTGQGKVLPTTCENWYVANRNRGQTATLRETLSDRERVAFDAFIDKAGDRGVLSTDDLRAITLIIAVRKRNLQALRNNEETRCEICDEVTVPAVLPAIFADIKVRRHGLCESNLCALLKDTDAVDFIDFAATAL